MDKYKIIEQIGKGEDGIVYSAIDKTNGEPRVIKILIDFDEYALKEAENYQHLSQYPDYDKHMPKFYEAFEVYNPEHQAVVVLEFVPGETMGNILEKNLSSKDKWNLLGKILESIMFFHQHGYCHSDFNPNNMLWDGQNIRILDLARADKISIRCDDEFHLKFIVESLYFDSNYSIRPRSIHDIKDCGKNFVIARAIINILNASTINDMFDIYKNTTFKDTTLCLYIKPVNIKDLMISLERVLDHDNILKMLHLTWPKMELSSLALECLTSLLGPLIDGMAQIPISEYRYATFSIKKLFVKSFWNGISKVYYYRDEIHGSERMGGIINYVMEEIFKDAGYQAYIASSNIITIWDIIDIINNNSDFKKQFGVQNVTVQINWTISEIEMTPDTFYAIDLVAKNNPEFKMSILDIPLSNLDEGKERYLHLNNKYQITINNQVVSFNSPQFIRGIMSYANWWGLDYRTLFSDLMKRDKNTGKLIPYKILI